MSDLIRLSDPRPQGYREIAPDGAAAHLAELRVVDVRQPDEFTGPLGHIPGAELVPLATITDAARSWPRDEALLVVCRSGARSASASAQLAGAGFTRVYNLAGGMTAWNAHALPTEGR